MKLYQKSYFAFLLGVLTLSVYPIYMGFCVVAENIANGSVDVANFPKYIIPYTPISIAMGHLKYDVVLKRAVIKAFMPELQIGYISFAAKKKK